MSWEPERPSDYCIDIHNAYEDEDCWDQWEEWTWYCMDEEWTDECQAVDDQWFSQDYDW